MAPPAQCRRMRYHRRVPEQDRWLDEKGFYRKHIVSDSTCLFRIVSEHVYKIQSHHEKVRKDCILYMQKNGDLFEQLVDGPFNDYVNELSKPNTHGGIVEIKVMSHMYKYDFIIYDNNKGPETFITNDNNKLILLYHVKEKKHFDVLYTKEYMADISFCQSLLYGILYKDVYKMIDVDYAVKKMLYGKDNNSIDYYMPESVLRRTSNQLSRLEYNNGGGDTCNDNKDSNGRVDPEIINFTIFPMDSGDSIMIALDTSNAKEMLDNKILPFPYKVAKALDSNIYRNVELDSWYEIKKDEQPSGQYFDGLSLQVGVKCLCSLNPNSSATYHCHIQDMKGEDGPCVVFVEELGEMRTVSMNQLKPLPAEEAKPWYTPLKKERAKFYSIAGILRQLGYVGITNNYKLKYKLKKAGGIGQELAQLKENIDWMSSKKRGEEKEYWSPQQDKGDSQYYTYLDKYTKMDDFQPYKIEMVTMPLVVEQSSNPPSSVADNTSTSITTTTAARSPSIHYQGGQQEHYALQACNGNELSPSPSYVPTTPISGVPVPTHPGGMIWSSGNGNMYNTYPVYCTPPHGASLPPPPPPPMLHAPLTPILLPRLSPLPSGVNMAVPRSMDVNGTDLPYNDVLTLRYFFNLGVEYMYACRGWSLPPPTSSPPPLPYHHTLIGTGAPPNTPANAAYTQHAPRVSPNQLAVELQQNLTLEENANTMHENKESNTSGKGNTNTSSNMQKGKGGVEYGGSRRGGMGGGGRYRGGGGGGNNHRNNYGRNQNYYRNNNNNNNHSNMTNKGGNNSKGGNSEGDVGSSTGGDKQDHQEGHQDPNAFGNNPNLSFISFPPPPLYRMPYYSVEGDAPLVTYTPPYLPYAPLPEDTVSSTSEGSFVTPGPPPYLGYLPTPPPMYYPPLPHNYTNYNPLHFTPSAPDNQNK